MGTVAWYNYFIGTIIFFDSVFFNFLPWNTQKTNYATA